MKKYKYLVALLGVCTMLSACGEKGNEGNDKNEVAETVTTESSQTTETSTSGTEIQGENEDVEPSQTESKIYAQNNGGHFVGMNDDRIYYIAPDEEAMYKSRLFANYLNFYCGPSSLMAYNCKADGVETITNGNFFGNLWVLKDSIFVNELQGREENGEVRVAVVDPDEKTVGYAKGESILGGDRAGNYVVTRGAYEDNHTTLYVYSDCETMTQVDVKDYLNFITVEDGYLIVANYDGSNKEIVCYDLKDSLKEYKLGHIPAREYEGYGDYPEFEQYTIQDGKLYLSICWYEGTGHFLAEQAIITADLTVNGSLVKLDLPLAQYESEEGVALFAVKDGLVSVTEGVPGEGFCTYSEGDYGYFDENGRAVNCGSGFGVRYDEDGEISFMNECTEYVNGRICMVNNHLVRDPGEDIGWRYAYIRQFTSIFIEEANGADGRNVENIVNRDYVDED